MRGFTLPERAPRRWEVRSSSCQFEHRDAAAPLLRAAEPDVAHVRVRAQVLLEAMASGLAVVATDRTGANDCMTDGKEGRIVPARDAEALAEAILFCYRHPDETRAMGRAARERIESQFTLEHYNQRVIALYQSLASLPLVGTAP